MKQFQQCINACDQTKPKPQYITGYYAMCKEQASDLATSCSQFKTYANAAKSDLGALDVAYDEQYVKTWFENNRFGGHGSFAERLRGLTNDPNLAASLKH